MLRTVTYRREPSFVREYLLAAEVRFEAEEPEDANGEEEAENYVLMKAAISVRTDKQAEPSKFGSALQCLVTIASFRKVVAGKVTSP